MSYSGVNDAELQRPDVRLSKGKARIFETGNQMLSTWYGNFMELPPEEQQLPHHKYTLRIPDGLDLENI